MQEEHVFGTTCKLPCSYAREQVIRCASCAYYDPHPTDGGVCFLPDGNGDFARWEVRPDGFCAWAEPIEAGDSDAR